MGVLVIVLPIIKRTGDMSKLRILWAIIVIINFTLVAKLVEISQYLLGDDFMDYIIEVLVINILFGAYLILSRSD